MPADLVYFLPQTPLLFKYAYWLSAAARWILAGPLPFNKHACRSFAIQSCMSVGVVLFYQPYLLVCLTISRAVPAGVVSRYRPYPLVWCLTICRACWCGVIIGHAFWCGTSLSAIPVGVVPHYRPCLLVWCLAIGHTLWCGASLSVVPAGVALL